ncbi:TAP42-like protein [Exophiala viscosa]|uniref:TAP42-like protein n=1 Tax=Exophiala viscosa TaxID=2486360 RepID=UPI0021951A3F|nr:TAP42-like protein [Exophiala viscosa]
MDTSEPSLKGLYNEAKSQQEGLDDLDPRSSAFKTTLQSIIDNFRRCQELIQQLSLFSKNEEVEDISTQDLQYLLVDYELAETKTRAYDSDRQSSLQESSRLLESFLSRLDQYGLLGASDRKLYERFLEQRDSFRIVSSTNPEDKRKIKIARFQEEKSLKQKLEYLRSESQKINIDDETVRHLHLAEIALAVNKAFSSLDMINQELEIVSHMRQAEPARADPPPDQRAPARSNGYSERLDGPTTLGGLGRKGGPLLSPSGKPLQPFTLTDKRTQLQQGVFRPDHSLPTMSIDDYLEEERRRGGIIDGGGNANAPQPEADEDNLEQVDAATMKARNWDEFVEANPKGAGNTLNRG